MVSKNEHLTYADKWMIRYATIAEWKHAISFALESGQNSDMFKSLRQCYIETRSYIVEDNQWLEEYRELDGLFRIIE